MWPAFSAIRTWLHDYEPLAVWLEGIALLAIFIWDRIDASQQRKETLSQMRIMESQARGAADSAAAANKSVEIILDKERARVRVKPGKLNLGPIAMVANYSVFNYGPTFAFIEGARAEIKVSTEKTIPNTDWFMPMSLPEAIDTNVEGIKDKAFFIETVSKLQEVIETIRAEKSFVHFVGGIEYKDVFGKEHKTEFAYVWTFSTLPTRPGEERDGYWLRYRTDET